MKKKTTKANFDQTTMIFLLLQYVLKKTSHDSRTYDIYIQFIQRDK